MSKTNTIPAPVQMHRPPAGLMPGDFSTELFGCLKTRKVFSVSNGRTTTFRFIASEQKAQLFRMMLNDDAAMDDLRHLPHEEAIEEFSFCVFGAANSEPDFNSDGSLGASDNFLCSNNCKCLRWASKNITLSGNRLTAQHIRIIQLMASGEPDKAIADTLNIAVSTLDHHKRVLFEYSGASSKTELITKAHEAKIL